VQFEEIRNVVRSKSGFPVVDDIIDRHSGSLDDWTSPLDIVLGFDYRAIGPIHGGWLLLLKYTSILGRVTTASRMRLL
jgi:hypothetical protein